MDFDTWVEVWYNVLIILIGIVVAGLMYGMIREQENRMQEGTRYAVDHRDR